MPDLSSLNCPQTEVRKGRESSPLVLSEVDLASEVEVFSLASCFFS